MSIAQAEIFVGCKSGGVRVSVRRTLWSKYIIHMLEASMCYVGKGGQTSEQSPRISITRALDCFNSDTVTS